MNQIWSSGVWLLLGMCAVVVGWWIWRVTVAVRTIARTPTASVEALNLHDAAVGWIGRTSALVTYLAVGLIPTLWRPDWSSDGAWPLAIAGPVTVVGLIVMELRWPVPGGTVRSAGLRRRRIRDILPQAGLSIAAVGLLAGGGLIVLCGGIAPMNTDSMAGAGRAFAWPGWRQTVPYSVGLALVVLTALLAARVLARRPALAGWDAVVDIAYRRAAMDRVLRVIAAVGFLVAAMVMNVLKNVAIDDPDIATGLRSTAAWTSVALAVIALVSIELFRVRLPKSASGAAAVAPAGPAP